MRHYFTNDLEQKASNERLIEVTIAGISLRLLSDDGMFSKEYLDYATRLLLEHIVLPDLDGKLLDVGCGYGPIGIFLAKKYHKDVVMIDVNLRALSLAKRNVESNNTTCVVLESDCLDGVMEDKFALIVTNPPIRAGKKVIYRMFEQAYTCLLSNGELWFIMQEKHGVKSAIKECQQYFSKVDIVYKRKGFYIVKCKKHIDTF